jgi:hypothetical protein
MFCFTISSKLSSQFTFDIFNTLLENTRKTKLFHVPLLSLLEKDDDHSQELSGGKPSESLKYLSCFFFYYFLFFKDEVYYFLYHQFYFFFFCITKSQDNSYSFQKDLNSKTISSTHFSLSLKLTIFYMICSISISIFYVQSILIYLFIFVETRCV